MEQTGLHMAGPWARHRVKPGKVVFPTRADWAAFFIQVTSCYKNNKSFQKLNTARFAKNTTTSIAWEMAQRFGLCATLGSHPMLRVRVVVLSWFGLEGGREWKDGGKDRVRTAYWWLTDCDGVKKERTKGETRDRIPHSRLSRVQTSLDRYWMI